MSTWDYVKAKVIYHYLLPLGLIAVLVVAALLYVLLADAIEKFRRRRWKK